MAADRRRERRWDRGRHGSRERKDNGMRKRRRDSRGRSSSSRSKRRWREEGREERLGEKETRKRKGDSREDKRLHAYFLMGLPGSGKSTVKKEKIEMKGVVDIDPDRIKRTHPDWRIDNGLHDRALDKYIHKWSVRKAVSEFRSITRAQKHSLVFDSSGSDHEWLIMRMERAIEKNYVISLIYVRIPVEVAVVRNRARKRLALAKDKNVPASIHWVPEDIIWRKAKYMDGSYRRAKRFADYAEIVSNYSEDELKDALKELDESCDLKDKEKRKGRKYVGKERGYTTDGKPGVEAMEIKRNMR